MKLKADTSITVSVETMCEAAAMAFKDNMEPGVTVTNINFISNGKQFQIVFGAEKMGVMAVPFTWDRHSSDCVAGGAGLTKLEYFAGLAMQSEWVFLSDGGQPQHMDHVAELCVKMAKAQLAALEKFNVD